MTARPDQPAPSSIHATAHALHRAGINTIPTRNDTSKRPAVAWKHHQTNPLPAAQIDDWYAGGNPRNYGLAAITGHISGNLEMTELEGRAAHHTTTLAQHARQEGHGDLWQKITTGWAEASPSGGLHWIYRLQLPAGERMPGNTKIAANAQREVLAETRGEGGYFITAPTDGAHHPSGRGWIRLYGGPESIPTITLEERATFHRILATIGAPEPEHPKPATLAFPTTASAPGAPSGDWTEGKRPGEDFELQTTWAEILEPHGWTYKGIVEHKGVRGHGWLRPGKDPIRDRDALSATTGMDPARDRLWAFSSSTPFPVGESILKFRAWSILNHGGDDVAAARALAKKGYGREPHVPLTLDSILPPTTTTEPEGTSSWTCSTSTTTSSSKTPAIEAASTPSANTPTANPAPTKSTTTSEPTSNETSSSPQENPSTSTTSTTSNTATAPASSTSTTATATTSTPPKSQTPSPTNPTPAAPSPEQTQTMVYSDDGNATILINHHHTRIRFCTNADKWLTWNGHTWQWEHNRGGRVRELFKALARTYPEDTKPETDHKRRALSARGTTDALTQAQTHPAITVTMDDLDAQPWELNTPDGIIDLRTGDLTPPDPAKLHTRTTRTAPDFQADTTRWEQFLADCFPNDPEMIDFLQRLVGYSVVGEVREHILPFLYGSGGNGKSVFLDVIERLLGDYAQVTASGFLMASRNEKHQTEVARLAGARWVNCSEVNQRDRFDEAKVKLLTGGDTLSGNFMRQDFFDFTPTHHLWLAGNFYPSVESGGESFWRRLIVIGFNHTVPPERRIAGLTDQLVEEHGPAILAWIARGAADYHRNGLQIPARVRVATEEYKESQDTVKMFLEERCTLHPGNANYTCSVKQFKREYEAWCFEEGEEPVRGRGLATQLKNHGVLVGRDAPAPTRGVGRLYGGIRLNSDDEALEAEHSRGDLFG